MRIYAHFEHKLALILHDLKISDIHLPLKVELIKNTYHTIDVLKKTFQNVNDIDNRVLISSICKTVQLGTAVKVAILVKFLEDIEGHTVNVAYIIKQYAYLKGISTKECSIDESKKVLE